MSKEWFKDTKFNIKSKELIKKCNEVIEDYQSQGIMLTLRQLYYQLVSANVIPNQERSYKNLSSLLTNARLAGLVDWGAIEDRARRPQIPSDFENLEQLVDAALASYKLPRWKGQDYYVELWVEKDALASVLSPIARRNHITLMVNRGYSSASAMYASAQRFIDGRSALFDKDKTLVLLYLGDMDPSGEDMVRDVQDRLQLFEVDLEVEKIALTMPQVKKYNPPPNPAKVTDPRAANYIAQHGNHSWEVDALPPNVLTKLIQAEIDQYLDVDKMELVKEQEERDKVLLRKAVESLRKKRK